MENTLNNLKKITLGTILALMTNVTYAAKDITASGVNYIYQLDSDPLLLSFPLQLHIAAVQTYIELKVQMKLLLIENFLWC